LADLEVQGMQELMDKVTAMGKLGKKVENKALLKAAEPILADAISNAPEQYGDGKAGLKISRPKSKSGTKYVLIGISKDDISEIFYMKFHEFGTSRMPAKPYLGPAYERNKSKAIDIIKTEVRRGLGL